MTKYAGNSLKKLHLLKKSLTENFIFCAVDKRHLPLSNEERVIMKTGETDIKSSNCKKLLGVKIDDKLIFNEHLNYIADNVSRRINAFRSLTPYMNERKKPIIMKSFFWSQFSYCSLVWMLHSCTLNNKINRWYERCLRIVYNDKKSTQENLLVTDRSASVHMPRKCLKSTETYLLRFSKNFSRREYWTMTCDICYNLQFQEWKCL